VERSTWKEVSRRREENAYVCGKVTTIRRIDLFSSYGLLVILRMNAELLVSEVLEEVTIGCGVQLPEHSLQLMLIRSNPLISYRSHIRQTFF
jgi:hypothetical protein